jgi:myo-inositol 2-dehydrogenase / D-chiro-inositol 1-dehydrogenase
MSRRGNRPGDHTNPFQREHDDLFDAIRTVKDYNEAERGAQATLTAILGRMATYSGKLVTWEEAMASQLQLTSDAEDWNGAAPVKPDENGFYPVAVPGISKAV